MERKGRRLCITRCGKGGRKEKGKERKREKKIREKAPGQARERGK